MIIEHNGIEYHIGKKLIEEAIIEILCEKTKSLNGVLYNEDGAYQMATYVLCSLGLYEPLKTKLQNELEQYFIDKIKKGEI